jgi:UDP-glucose 4-epimerase
MVEHRSRGRAVVSLRLTNCYGPRLCLSKGSNQGFLGHWLRAALVGDPFEVWGGEQLRDVAYVDDVVRALLLAATIPQCHGKIFNIGGSPPYSLNDLADLLCKVTGGRTSYVKKELPRSQASIDIGSYYADDTAFRATSGWAPTMGVEDGLAQTFDWYRSHLASYLNSEAMEVGTQIPRGE